MKKLILLNLTLVLLFSLSASQTEAKLLTVSSGGEVVWNVLSEKDSLVLGMPRASYLEVKRIADSSNVDGAEIKLDRSTEGVDLVISSESGDRTLKLEGKDTDLIEIEERPQVENIKIGISDGDFSLKQDGVLARTQFPIRVDSENAALSLVTETGEKYVYITPRQAVESLLRARTVTRVNAQKQIKIEEEGGVLVYKMSGEKILDIFNLYQYPVEVEASVSATTGEIIRTNAPIWLTVASYILS